MSNQNESPESIIVKFPSGEIMNITFYYGKQPNGRGNGVIAYNHDIDWACGPGYSWEEALNNCIGRTRELKGSK